MEGGKGAQGVRKGAAVTGGRGRLPDARGAREYGVGETTTCRRKMDLRDPD